MATWIRKSIEIISGTHSVEEIHGNSQEDMVIRSPQRPKRRQDVPMESLGIATFFLATHKKVQKYGTVKFTRLIHA